MAKYIKSNGEVSDVFPAAKQFTLEELSALVGGSIEVVRTSLNGVVMIVNEDGAVVEPPLPINPVATSMYHEVGGLPDWPARGDIVLTRMSEIE